MECPSQKYLFHRILPAYKFLRQAIDEVEELSESLKLKVIEEFDRTCSQTVSEAGATLKIEGHVKFFKKSREHETWVLDKFRCKEINGNAENQWMSCDRITLFIYKPIIPQGFKLVSQSPYTFHLERKQVPKPKEKKLPKQKPKKFGPLDDCAKLGRKKKKNEEEEEPWRKPMPFNEKHKVAKNKAEVVELTEKYSALGIISKLRGRYRKEAKYYKLIKIRNEKRSILDLKPRQVTDLYRRKYKVQMKLTDKELAELARDTGLTLHLRGHNVKVDSCDKPDGFSGIQNTNRNVVIGSHYCDVSELNLKTSGPHTRLLNIDNVIQKTQGENQEDGSTLADNPWTTDPVEDSVAKKENDLFDEFLKDYVMDEVGPQLCGNYRGSETIDEVEQFNMLSGAYFIEDPIFTEDIMETISTSSVSIYKDAGLSSSSKPVKSSFEECSDPSVTKIEKVKGTASASHKFILGMRKPSQLGQQEVTVKAQKDDGTFIKTKSGGNKSKVLLTKEKLSKTGRRRMSLQRQNMTQTGKLDTTGGPSLAVQELVKGGDNEPVNYTRTVANLEPKPQKEVIELRLVLASAKGDIAKKDCSSSSTDVESLELVLEDSPAPTNLPPRKVEILSEETRGAVGSGLPCENSNLGHCSSGGQDTNSNSVLSLEDLQKVCQVFSNEVEETNNSSSRLSELNGISETYLKLGPDEMLDISIDISRLMEESSLAFGRTDIPTTDGNEFHLEEPNLAMQDVTEFSPSASSIKRLSSSSSSDSMNSSNYQGDISVCSDSPDNEGHDAQLNTDAGYYNPDDDEDMNSIHSGTDGYVRNDSTPEELQLVEEGDSRDGCGHEGESSVDKDNCVDSSESFSLKRVARLSSTETTSVKYTRRRCSLSEAEAEKKLCEEKGIQEQFRILQEDLFLSDEDDVTMLPYFCAKCNRPSRSDCRHSEGDEGQGNNGFQCTKCEKSFKLNMALKQHMKKAHKRVSFSSQLASVLVFEKDRSTNFEGPV